MYYTYVLECIKDGGTELYTGYCSDLKNRYQEHLHKEVKTTKMFDQIRLIYYEACLNKTDARKREIQLKTGFGRGYLNRRLSNYFKKRD